MRKLLALIAVLGLVAQEARAADTLRVIRGLVPGEKGNPYSNGTNIAWDVYAAMFDPLTRVLNTGDLVPWLGESWTERADGTWVFTLRPAVAFSDGEPLDAAAVVAVIDYLKSDAGQREPASNVTRS